MEPCVLPIIYLINNIHFNPHKYKRTIRSIARNVCFYSKKRSLDPVLVTGLISHESRFHTRIVSKTNDIGLMQLQKRFVRDKCNLLRVKCNIKVGTRKLAAFKRAGNLHGYHWLRRYNWNSKQHHLRILWITQALKKAKNGHPYLFNIIKRRGYQKFKITYRCIRKNLCGQLKMEKRN